jgi:hypothetical protein
MATDSSFARQVNSKIFTLKILFAQFSTDLLNRILKFEEDRRFFGSPEFQFFQIHSFLD